MSSICSHRSPNPRTKDSKYNASSFDFGDFGHSGFFMFVSGQPKEDFPLSAESRKSEILT